MPPAVEIAPEHDIVIRPQKGPQEQFLASSADILFYGGAAGGGKTWAELVEPLRHILPSEKYPNGVPGFSGVIFRRVAPQIRNEGGLWDESMKIYPQFGGKPRETILEWAFPDGQTMRFASMQHPDDRFNWQGAQIPYIAFDELDHFTEEQFWYMLSRNRSLCGIRPYVRATVNPNADSWVAELIAWWIDQDQDSPSYGIPIPERSGVIRYFVRQGSVIHWGDSVEELTEFLPQEILDRGIDPRALIRSFTFVPATIYDNKALIEQNPEYLGNLLSLTMVERERLLNGNWKIRPTAGNVFNKSWWKYADAVPHTNVVRRVRAWDKAGTDKKEKGAKEHRTPFTAGVLMSRVRTNQGDLYYIEDAVDAQLSALKREQLIESTAVSDPINTKVRVEQEPGSGGKESSENTVRHLAGFHVRAVKVASDKYTRALAYSAQVEAGNVFIVPGEWTKKFIDQHHGFPDARLKDYVDAASLAFNELVSRGGYNDDDFPDHTR